MNTTGKLLGLAVVISMSIAMPLTVKAGSADKINREKVLQEFKAADLNKDGYVDENEYKRYVEKEFDSMKKGMKNEARKKQGEEFVVTGKEKKQTMKLRTFLNGRLRFFNEADANKDRLLSLQEFTEMEMMDPVR